jgi:hypothetical protein
MSTARVVAGNAFGARRLDAARLAAKERVCDDTLPYADAPNRRPDFDDVTHVLVSENEREGRERRRRRTRREGDDVEIAATDPAKPRANANPALAGQHWLGNIPDRGARVRADIQAPGQPAGRERR